MASPFLESVVGPSSWPLVWVRLAKDFSFDLGGFAVLALVVQWLVPGLRLSRRLLLLLPMLLVCAISIRGVPELLAKPLLIKAERLSQEGCRLPPNVLVVLGGGLAGPDDLAISTASRVRHAAAWTAVLSRDQRASLRVILSGGPSHPGVRRAESELMRVAFRAGRPEIAEQNIEIETRSLNTRDNATRVAALVNERTGLEPPRVALVTSWLHMPRAAGAFRAVGIQVCPVPAPGVEFSSEGFLNFRNGERTVRVFNEYAGFVGYRWKGWLK